MNFKRIILIILSCALLLYSTTKVSSNDPNIKVKTHILKPTIVPTLTPTPTPTPPFPVRIIIPKLQIDTSVEPVGNDENGTMQLPQATDTVGWYIEGYKPGEQGNAVIGGHLDLATGAPAVFYQIRDLAPGDTITIQDRHGVLRIFQVTSLYSYPYNEVPIEA